ncbi:MAG: hypothetical protein BVN33_17195 [Proteobacteria bacterium ST_bin13]|nr:MAG: hypothetical protein BVN33_17195 [Proteobacteria bacterium ST_bin13]
MVMQPICEPVDLPLGLTALVAQVAMAAGSLPPARLLHFHDVAEIVLFGNTHGRLFCAGESFAIRPGSVVFVPSMCYHDYLFDDGPKHWTLIQIEPYLVEQLARQGDGATLARALCVDPDNASGGRLHMLAEWLAETARTNAADPMIDRIVGLILSALVRLPTVAGEPSADTASHLSRFLPVVERLRQAPGGRLTLGEAATLCHVSPAYFSRRFAAVFGCGFADYVTSYRLHVASRRIATTATPLSEIGYDLGFSSHSHFTARFRERFGIAPREYRKRLARALA